MIIFILLIIIVVIIIYKKYNNPSYSPQYLNSRLVNSFEQSFYNKFGIKLNIPTNTGYLRTEYSSDYWLNVIFDKTYHKSALVFITKYQHYSGNNYDSPIIFDNYGKYTNNFITGQLLYLVSFDFEDQTTNWRLLKRMSREDLFRESLILGYEYEQDKLERYRKGLLYNGTVECMLCSSHLSDLIAKSIGFPNKENNYYIP